MAKESKKGSHLKIFLFLLIQFKAYYIDFSKKIQVKPRIVIQIQYTF